MTSNIHGYCPHCNTNFDGELIIEFFITKGYTEEEADAIAAQYEGYNQHGQSNRWDRRIGLYDMEKDRTVANRCPDCGREI